MKKVVIITPTFNKLEAATRPFIESLYKYTDENLFDLIIVDNASTDGTVEYLKEIEKEHSNFKLICNSENLGYSKGNNIGIKLGLESDYKYFGLLNNDILFTPDWLENTISVFEKDEQIGMTAPRDKGRKKIFKKVLTPDNYIEHYKDYLKKFKEEFEYVLEPLFCCVFVKREVIEKIGLMDENYTPAFWEDHDYIMRTFYAGFSCTTCNRAFIYHNHSMTSSAVKKEIFERNKRYFFKKHPLGEWIWKHKRSNVIRDLKNYIKESLK